MRILYCWIGESDGLFERTELNFDPWYWFSYDTTGERLAYAKRKDAIGSRFFSVCENSQGQVDNVNAIIGKNGAGKTSLAAVLTELRRTGKHDFSGAVVFSARLGAQTDEFIHLFHFKKGEECCRYHTLEKLKEWDSIDCSGDPFDFAPENYFDFVYFSPHFTTEGPYELMNGCVNLSTNAMYVADAQTLYETIKTQSHIYPNLSLSTFAFDERRRALEFAFAFFGLPKKERGDVPFPLPRTVALTYNDSVLLKVKQIFKGRAAVLEQDITTGLPEADRQRVLKDGASKKKLCNDVLALLESAKTADFFAGVFFLYVACYCNDINVVDSYHEGHADWYAEELVALATSVLPKVRHAEDDVLISQEIVRRLRELATKDDAAGNLVMKEALKDRRGEVCAFFELLTKFMGKHGVRQSTNTFLHTVQVPLVNEDGAARQDSELFKLLDLHKRVHVIIPFIKIDFVPRISSGEMAYLTMFGRIYAYLQNQLPLHNSSKDFVLFVDEGETTLHPDWQRQLVWNVIWFVERFAENRRAHVIFASHSPVVLSDIPDSNVLFLERRGMKADVADCKSRYEASDFSNTFGAHIFDLYNRDFAMVDGTIGKFADGKIRKAMGRIGTKRDEYTKREDEKVISMVGDPFIRNYIQDQMAERDGWQICSEHLNEDDTSDVNDSARTE